MNETKAKIKALAIIFLCCYALVSCFVNKVQAEDGIRDFCLSRGLGDVYKRQGLQTFGIGVSGGKHFIDKNCERLKLARILNDFGMKVAAVAILCQDERVFESMIQAGTPCPIDGKIGKQALALWEKYDFERPDYKAYIKRMKERKKVEPKPIVPELHTR